MLASLRNMQGFSGHSNFHPKSFNNGFFRLWLLDYLVRKPESTIFIGNFMKSLFHRKLHMKLPMNFPMNFPMNLPMKLWYFLWNFIAKLHLQAFVVCDQRSPIFSSRPFAYTKYSAPPHEGTLPYINNKSMLPSLGKKLPLLCDPQKILVPPLTHWKKQEIFL